MAKGKVVTASDPAERQKQVVVSAQQKRERMQQVCANCHTQDYIASFYRQYDDLVVLYNDKFAKPAQKLMGELTAETKLYAASIGVGKYYHIYVRGCEYGLNWDNSMDCGHCLRVPGVYSAGVLCNADGKPVGVTCLDEISLGAASAPLWPASASAVEDLCRTSFGTWISIASGSWASCSRLGCTRSASRFAKRR